jgi:hypothetical protein
MCCEDKQGCKIGECKVDRRLRFEVMIAHVNNQYRNEVLCNNIQRATVRFQLTHIQTAEKLNLDTKLINFQQRLIVKRSGPYNFINIPLVNKGRYSYSSIHFFLFQLNARKYALVVFFEKDPKFISKELIVDTDKATRTLGCKTL